jgi:hypothetical protein
VGKGRVVYLESDNCDRTSFMLELRTFSTSKTHMESYWSHADCILACNLRTSSFRSFFVFDVGTTRARFDLGMANSFRERDKVGTKLEIASFTQEYRRWGKRRGQEIVHCNATAQKFDISMPRFPDACADHPQRRGTLEVQAPGPNKSIAWHSNEPQKSFRDSERQFI